MSNECPVCDEPLDESSSLHWCSPECQEVWQADQVPPDLWFPLVSAATDDRVWSWVVALLIATTVALILLTALGVSAWTLID